MRMIDADCVFANLKPYEPSDEEWSVTGGTALRLIHNAIDNAPTIDAVPVVRCKDCKYCFCNYDGHIQCSNLMWLICPTHNAYCNYGERM